MAEKIIQCGYMSGDTFAAAALLAADSTIRIILVKDTKATGEYADKTKLIQTIYQESSVGGQVVLFDMSKSSVAITDLWKSVSKAYSLGTAQPDPRSTDPLVAIQRQLCNNYAPSRAWPRSITAVTGLLATTWLANPAATRTAVAKAWKVGKLPAEQKFALYEYMAQVFIKTAFQIRKNIVVLWSRQSGKRGGAHLELDSSYMGIRQLANAFANVDKRATVLLAGDESRSSKKMDAFAADSVHIVNVTNMWDAQVWTDMFGDAKYLAQFAFFKYLAADYNVVHVGMRSGMLEAMALLGMKTFYLEGVGSESGDRMLGFSRAGITYTRVQIDEAPGLTGRISESKRLFTKESVEGAIARGAARTKDRGGFRYNFARKDTPAVDTDWAAKNYAKANLLGQPLDDRSYDEVKQWDKMGRDMLGLRGFTKTSADAILKLVGDTFV